MTDRIQTMPKTYQNISSKTKTVPSSAQKGQAKKFFWHPENATIGDEFFCVPSASLTAEGVVIETFDTSLNRKSSRQKA
jgi:hypothetical protein